MKNFAIIATLVMTASVAGAVSYPVQPPKSAEDTVIQIQSVKLQEFLGANAPPGIPKSWRLVSVSAGEIANSSNLWFQDADGSVYLLPAITASNRLMIHNHVYKIPAKLTAAPTENKQ